MPQPGWPSLTPTRFRLTSTAFARGAGIPRRHSCEGENRSPPLEWSGVPDEAASLAITCMDPDAPRKTWVHWLVWNLPARSTGLPEAVPQDGAVPSGGRQGRNDSGHTGYDGPCPPPGKLHRYYFTLYVLDRELGLEGGAAWPELEAAMKGHVVATAELMGTYQRSG